MSLPLSHLLMVEFLESMTAIVEVEREVLARFAAAQTVGLCEMETTRELLVDAFLELFDHSFVRQSFGWSMLSDRESVVSMTTLVEFMIEHVAPLCLGRVA